ncbi:helix-turn-helix transcriptional regulator [Amycolatopsis orientalis]|uniref:Helix-turn-helix transcriptional regulator n=1 Tax=Amycolatopsis orientalis TaxID=31958 RepID=A0A193BUL5_AMYOR|nr:LuxR family transcriptional regulator [Amycolatopsis orientalis]ANN15870.1 helix-turn-helix transcriptional regulator [Amycolatopsis orientalis]
MTELDKPDSTAAALKALEAARMERARLSELGRWTEAGEAAIAALRQVLSPANPDIVGPDLGGLVYVAGSPRPGVQTSGRHGHPVPPERLVATRAMLLVNNGNDPQAAAEFADRALQSFNWRDVGTFWYSILSLVYLDDRVTALRHCERAMTRSGWAATSALIVLRARLAGLSGDPQSAVRLLIPAITQGPRDQFTDVGVAWAVEALVDLGDLDRADDLMRTHGLSGSLDAVTDRAEVLSARGLLSQAIGQSESAYKDFIACGRELAGWGVTNPAVIPWRSRAALCAAIAGREAVALPLAEDELSNATRWGTARAIGTALRTVSLLYSKEHGVKLLKNAIELLTRSGARTTLLEAQYQLAIKLRLEGRHDEVRSVLRNFRETALSTCNKHWQTRADEAIRQWAVAGDTPTVTSKERKVANLAQAGLSNGEIAKRLSLTTSTVEFHLSNMYRKLAISGRSELRSIPVPIL